MILHSGHMRLGACNPSDISALLPSIAACHLWRDHGGNIARGHGGNNAEELLQASNIFAGSSNDHITSGNTKNPPIMMATSPNVASGKCFSMKRRIFTP